VFLYNRAQEKLFVIIQVGEILSGISRKKKTQKMEEKLQNSSLEVKRFHVHPRHLELAEDIFVAVSCAQALPPCTQVHLAREKSFFFFANFSSWVGRRKKN